MTDRSRVGVSIVLLALAHGCAAEVAPSEAIVFDPCGVAIAPAEDLTSTELASVDEALQLWNEAASLEATRTQRGAEGALTIRFAPSLPAFFGRYDGTTGSILINRDIADTHTRAITVAHELGHAFGLEHVPVEIEASLMNPANTTVAPSARDVERLRAAWGDCRSSNYRD